MNFQYLLERVIKAALDAGEEILKVYQTDFHVEYKGDKSPLTEADKRSNDCIISSLSDFQIPFLTEETVAETFEKRKEWSKVWIIDPLDGTKEFVKRNGEFTVNIALIEDQVPVLGVIYSPVFKDLYYAAKGLGSFKVSRHDVLSFLNENSSNLEKLFPKAIRLPLVNEKNKYTIVASRSHLSSETYHHIENLKSSKGEVELINSGSSLKICMVAEGTADEYPRFGPTMEWDTAAGQAIVELAGGKLLRQSDLKPLKYNREELTNPSFIVYSN
ncbi:MAG: 3'(2'),5'-bisphosphate nucleotidase CysQ [Bacteroidota bacterium]|jgi:3'(2'), 5'-bisphosphate nucleotidase